MGYNFYKRIFTICLFLLFLFSFCRGQFQDTTKSNNVFIEFFGSGGYGSINYERLIIKYPSLKTRVGMTFGFSTYRVFDLYDKFNPDLIFPVSLRWYYGTRHNTLLGLGQTISIMNRLHPDRLVLTKKTGISANLIIGYRYDTKNYNIQISYVPTYEQYETLRHTMAFSFGFKF